MPHKEILKFGDIHGKQRKLHILKESNYTNDVDIEKILSSSKFLSEKRI